MATPRRPLRIPSNLSSRRSKLRSKYDLVVDEESDEVIEGSSSTHSDYSDDEVRPKWTAAAGEEGEICIKTRFPKKNRQSDASGTSSTSPRKGAKVLGSRMYPDLKELRGKEYVGEAMMDRKEGRFFFARVGLTPTFLIFMTLLLVASMLTIAHIAMWYIFTSPEAPQPVSLDAVLTEIQSGLKVLFQGSHQTKHFWTQVLSLVHQVVEENPSQPAVLLMVVPLDAKATAICLTHTILGLISGAFGDSKFVSFDAQSSSHRSPNAQKRDLDDALQGLSGHRAAAVFNMEKVSPEAVMMFHAYCDNENAPFKRAFIVLTLEMDSPHSDLVADRIDHVVHRFLMDSWTPPLREDDAAAVFSRVANAIVLVNPEKDADVKALCPY